MFGVSIITNLCNHPLLISKVGFNDKTKSLDGGIEVYKQSFPKSVETLFETVDIQIKTKCNTKYLCKKKMPYKFKKGDLKNFKNKTGVLFFYIVTDDNYPYVDDFKIYYREFYPDETQRLLESIDSKQKTVTLKLNVLEDATFDNFYELIKLVADKRLDCVSNANIKTVKISETDNYNLSNFKFNIFYDTNNKKFKFPKIIGRAKDELGYNVNIENDGIEISQVVKNVKILIKDEVYYQNGTYVFNFNKNKSKLELSSNLTLEILGDSFPINLNIYENSSVKDLLYDLHFLEIIVKEREFTVEIDSKKEKSVFTITNDSSLNKEVFRLKLLLEKITHYCNKLKIDTNDLLFKYVNLDYHLLDKLMSKETEIKELSYGMLKLSENRYPIIKFKGKLANWLNSELNIYITNDKTGKVYQLPTIEFFKYDDLKEMKLSHEYIKESIDIIEEMDMDFQFSSHNDLLLKLLLLYDDKKDVKYLEHALALSDIIGNAITDADLKVINRLNKCQILQRQGNNLNNHDKNFLEKLLDDKNIFYRFSASILLGKIEIAKEYFENFSEEEKETVKTWPIFNLL